MPEEDAVQNARSYYDGSDADGFYSTIWGGEDIHIGIYEEADEAIRVASRRTVARMADTLAERAGARPTPETRILDIGAGYGGSGRYLASTYGCHVSCLNLSEVQNRRNRELTAQQRLADRIDVVEGNFEELPFPAAHFDVIWSQDAMLHSGNRGRVVAEAARVLRSAGLFVFTDPMQADNADPAQLQPVLDRINLSSLGSPAFYRRTALENGLDVLDFRDLTTHLVRHYSRVLEELEHNEMQAREISGDEYVERMKRGLAHWVGAGESGDLVWGVFLLRKR
jgi:sarcosine/dimethylglycine N-methyltransferase